MTRPGPKPLTLEQFAEMFWSNVDMSGGPDACWPWKKGHLKPPPSQQVGYGVVQARGLFTCPQPTHRVAFWLTRGRWPSPITRHSCNNYPCSNPTHLLEGTHKENTADTIADGQFKIGVRTSSTWSKGDTLQTRQAMHA